MNPQGRFVGVIKAVLNVRQLISALDRVKARSEDRTTRLRLVCRQRVIYDTQGRALLPGPLEASLREALVQQGGDKGFVEVEDSSGGKTLVAFYRLRPAPLSSDLEATLLVEHDTTEVLAPIAGLRTQLLYIIVLMIGVSFVGGWFLAGSIARPVIALKHMASEISRGNLDVFSHVRASLAPDS